MDDPPTSANTIENAIVVPDKAEQVAAIIFDAIRADVGRLHAEVTGIRDATGGIQAELILLANKADLQKVRADLRAKIERVERRLLIGFGVVSGLLAGLVIAALRYLPPVGHS
jgi:hypothetical protein